MHPDLGIIQPNLRQPHEPFHVSGDPQPLTVGGFWAWACSDLIVNTTRGLLAEYLVATALGDPGKVREPWRPFDVLAPGGTRVEVKSASYIQSWAQRGLSPVSFQIGPTRAWDASTGAWQEDARRQADVYVFALLAHQDQATVDPTDLTQWRFWVLGTAVLDEAALAAKSISLSRLVELGAVEASFEELVGVVQSTANVR